MCGGGAGATAVGRGRRRFLISLPPWYAEADGCLVLFHTERKRERGIDRLCAPGVFAYFYFIKDHKTRTTRQRNNQAWTTTMRAGACFGVDHFLVFPILLLLLLGSQTNMTFLDYDEGKQTNQSTMQHPPFLLLSLISFPSCFMQLPLLFFPPSSLLRIKAAARAHPISCGGSHAAHPLLAFLL